MPDHPLIDTIRTPQKNSVPPPTKVNARLPHGF